MYIYMFLDTYRASYYASFGCATLGWLLSTLAYEESLPYQPQCTFHYPPVSQ